MVLQKRSKGAPLPRVVAKHVKQPKNNKADAEKADIKKKKKKKKKKEKAAAEKAHIKKKKKARQENKEKAAAQKADTNKNNKALVIISIVLRIFENVLGSPGDTHEFCVSRTIEAIVTKPMNTHNTYTFVV